MDSANSVYNNGGFEFYNGTADTIDFEYNYWGSEIKEEIESDIFNGPGYVDFSPWTDAQHSTLYSFTAIKNNPDCLPLRYSLSQNYPNPFNPITTIRYQLSDYTEVDLTIYTILGQKVATLISKTQPAGTYKVEWNAKQNASGIYLYRLSTNKGFTQTRKLILLK